MSVGDVPLVTVYVTNHNYGAYVGQAVASVLAQTFCDYELIIIDDGSTDDSREIIKKYDELENVFTVFQNKQGLNRTNNNAIKLSRGRFIMRLDADDYLDKHALELMVKELEQDPDLAMVFPDYYLVDENGSIIDQVRRHDFDSEVSLMDLPAHGACTLIRKTVLMDVGGYDEAFRCQDCYDIWLKIAPHRRVSNINLPLFYYRQHSTNLTKDETRLLQTRAEIKAKHVQLNGLSKPSVLAVLPVRGNATDPQSLTLSRLGDKALIEWSIDAALDSGSVDDVVVTTPDAEIMNFVNDRYSDRVFVVQRPLEMARMNTPLEPSILEAVHWYSRENSFPELLVVLFAEAPFRSSVYIDKAVHTQQLYGVDVVDGIREEDDIFYYHNGGGLQPWHLNSGLRMEREKLFRRAGGIHLIRSEYLEQTQNMLSGRVGHIVLDQRSAFKIRSEMDWRIAQFLAERES